MRRLAVAILGLWLACCAAKTILVPEPTTWILPLSAPDTDRVCVMQMTEPIRRCITAGELRGFVRSVRAN